MRLGDLYFERGSPADIEHAARCFERTAEIHKRLLRMNPNSAEAARDAAISLTRLSDFLLADHGHVDPARALRSARTAVEIAERLFSADATSSDPVLDYVSAVHRLGTAWLRSDEPDAMAWALEYFDMSVRFAEQVYGTNPQNVIAARAYAVSLSKRAQAQLQSESIDLARTAQDLEKFLDVVTRVYASTPKNPSAAWDVAVAHYQLAQYHRRRSDEAGAAEHFAASLGVLRQFEDAGWPMDAHIRRLYDQLKQTLGSS